MSKNRKPLLGSILGVVLVCTGFWLAGYDFDERGVTALFLLLMCIAGGFVGFMFSQLD